jgi:hypothetical protein
MIDAGSGMVNVSNTSVAARRSRCPPHRLRAIRWNAASIAKGNIFTRISITPPL